MIKTENDMTKLGYRLKEYRIKNHMTQMELARYIGVSSNTIHLWETKRCRPAMSSLIMLSDLLGAPLVEILIMSDELYQR